jgi:hypothetical protein
MKERYTTSDLGFTAATITVGIQATDSDVFSLSVETQNRQ